VAENPVFYDPTGRRRRRSIAVLGALLALILTAAIGFALTVLAVPVGDPLHPVGERVQARPLKEHLGRIGRRIGWLPSGRAHATPSDPVTVGFYVPWDPDSGASLQRNVKQLDWVVPVLGSITQGGKRAVFTADTRFERIITAATSHPRVLPMVQNAANDQWDGAGMAAILASPARRGAMLKVLTALVEREKGGGIAFDFEELPRAALPDYLRFLAETRAAFAKRGWLVTLAVPLGDTDWNLAAFARVADRLFLMDYDEHSPGYAPGPIASQRWFVQRLQEALRQVPRGKAIVAVGNYAYDWHGDGSDNLSVEEAWLAASESDAVPGFDRTSGNSTFSYEEGGVTHTVWILDAASAYNQLQAVRREGVAGVALWRLGSEDPGFWPALAASVSGKRPDLAVVSYQGSVDVEGSGELLRIEATPRNGARQVGLDRTGLIGDVVFQRLPSPYVVRRGGDRPGQVALTFDDGPDATWTPRVLDILEAKHAPATFFVIGENAISHPSLLNRIVAGGSELGNHSYTHPNLAQVSPRGTRLELNATQRLIEAYTRHSTRLFRAPYFGDAEPTTSEELRPAYEAQQAGYLNVGLHVDPDDWKRPGVQAIVQKALLAGNSDDPDRSTRIILLHDGGGDRAQTVAALPAIIDGLRAKGLKLVTVSALAGVPPQSIMPPVEGSDLLAVRVDVGVFLFLAAILWTLKWLFYVAISLGIARAVLMAALAVRAHAREPKPPAGAPDALVSVLIPAFNEARVIEGSVRRVLASEGARVEVIVIDDGSKDETSAIVAKAFANEPRVRLLTLENGGKARALNLGLELASSDIVIALDADTQFEPTTIARLARWFADPGLGAVAGNAKVGNRVNIVTRWQATEYVTAQNLERRALTRFEAITVVPGAVGAWRRTALDAVGGYPVDTLAEDQDLTIAIQRAAWRVAYDIDAVAWTEAPETLRALGKQRFRWAYGTLQCLWKHRAVIRTRRPLGLALVGLPQAWLFQIIFAMISPVIDLALIISAVGTAIRVHQHGWAQTQSDVLTMAIFWFVFTAVDLLSGFIAYRLEPRERRYPFWRLITQRIVYRQLMYGVVLRAIGAALSGPRVGWGKLERTGRAATA
jgi:cellulose synthase/poly-beta-1,6-N-acetylglucosamine synthase-like glycosyltransferase/peptidoglycan/xylan/chitin deacetylase (PgdA/CDA1 family)/spore germination protein YaaH